MSKFFYYSVAKLPTDMNADELADEITAALQYEDRCREVGQGISVKNSYRKQSCELELLKKPGGIDRWTELVVHV